MASSSLSPVLVARTGNVPVETLSHVSQLLSLVCAVGNMRLFMYFWRLANSFGVFGLELFVGALLLVSISKKLIFTELHGSSVIVGEDEGGPVIEIQTFRSRNQTRKLAPTRRHPRILIPEPVAAQDEAEIVQYHRLEEDLCRKKLAERPGTNWCPCVPPNLQGRIRVKMLDDEDWSAIEEAVGSDVEYGGSWKPADCIPHTRVAFVVPCRDRDSHLRVLLRHLYPILKRQMIQFRVFVVDQRRPMLFNKAASMDVGFLEALKRFQFDCVVFHDVDLLLEDDRALLRCGPSPRHYARALDKFGYGHYSTFGGVVSLTPDMFRAVNGYSLKYFGWGGEDDDMWSRVNQLWPIHGMPSVVSRYSSIAHAEDPTNLQNPNRHALIDKEFEKTQKNLFEGLTDVVYDINAVELRPLFTRFEVDLNVTNLEYPKFRSFRYRRAAGICQDPDVILTSSGVSWSSCRFQCDSYADRPCFGFSYATRKCTLIRAVCSLSLVPGWTYVKEQELPTTD